MPARSWYRISRGVFLTFAAVLAFSFAARFVLESLRSDSAEPEARIEGPFTYEFSSDGILQEAGSSDESSSPYWWLDSGGKLIIEDGVGKTVHGTLPRSDRWRGLYAQANADDTDDGARPQNLFRLLTRSAWHDARVEASFRITADNASESPNKNISNGILLMSRYRDGNNLYYAGLRVDGHAVIKKKSGGVYHTMAEKPVIDGDGDNLLPLDAWIRLRMETRTINDQVVITLSREHDGAWEELLSTRDTGQFDGTDPIIGPHPVGIRTDFMDVEFDDFRAEDI